MPSTICHKLPVTLSVEEVETLLGMLRTYAGTSWDHARRTKSAVIRAHCEQQGAQASALEAAMVRRLYVRDEVQS